MSGEKRSIRVAPTRLASGTLSVLRDGPTTQHWGATHNVKKLGNITISYSLQHNCLPKHSTEKPGNKTQHFVPSDTPRNRIIMCS